ncbi:MAG: hypothetical protein ACTSU6_06730 [Candidatus Njordarchaeales archaeon]
MKNATEKEAEKFVKEADNSAKAVKKELNKIKKEFSKLRPHSRLFLANELVARILSWIDLPPFVVISLLEGLKDLFKLPYPNNSKESERAKISYIG